MCWCNFSSNRVANDLSEQSKPLPQEDPAAKAAAEHEKAAQYWKAEEEKRLERERTAIRQAQTQAWADGKCC